MPSYDPRGAWGQGLSYAVANRGACHLSAATFVLEVFPGFLNPNSTRAKAQFVKFFENLFAAVNSPHVCQFSVRACSKSPQPPFAKGEFLNPVFKGKLHALPDPSPLVRLTGQAPIVATVWELERLRCNLCGQIYTARAPEIDIKCFTLSKLYPISADFVIVSSSPKSHP